MSIVYHESSKIFHLYNQTISYIMMVLPNGHMGQLYYGKKIRDKEDFSYLLELAPRDMASYLYENERIQVDYHLIPYLERLIPIEKPYFSDYF